MTTVVLDTNELQQDFLCRGLKYQLLTHGGFHPPLDVVVPAVVVEELVANHAREVERLSRSAQTAVGKLTRLGVAARADVAAPFDFRAYLLERFDEVLGISVLDWPTVPHEALVARSVNRVPPFDDDGGGYRDSLVWADVLSLAADGRHVALVSHDRAFAGASGLADALAAEVAELPGSVELVRDFGAWLVGRVPWKVAKLDEAVEYSRDAEFGEWLSQSDFLTEIEPEAADLGFPRAPYSVVIDHVDWAGNTVHLGSKVAPGGATLVEYDILEDVHFEAELSDDSPLPDQWQVMTTWLPGRIRVGGVIRMIVRVGVLYDSDGWSIEELSWRRADGAGAGFEPQPAVDPNQLPLFSAGSVPT